LELAVKSPSLLRIRHGPRVTIAIVVSAARLLIAPLLMMESCSDGRSPLLIVSQLQAPAERPGRTVIQRAVGAGPFHPDLHLTREGGREGEQFSLPQERELLLGWDESRGGGAPTDTEEAPSGNDAYVRTHTHTHTEMGYSKHTYLHT